MLLNPDHYAVFKKLPDGSPCWVKCFSTPTEGEEEPKPLAMAYGSTEYFLYDSSEKRRLLSSLDEKPRGARERGRLRLFRTESSAGGSESLSGCYHFDERPGR
jgi:hypothetical protein